MDAQATTADAPRTVTLADLVAALGRLRWYLLGGAIAGLALALAVAFLATPRYRASVTVMPVTDGRQMGGPLPGLLARFGGGGGLALAEGASRDEAVAVLKSRQFTAALISDEQLMPALFPDKWDAAAGRWRELPADEVPTEWDAWRLFDRKVRGVREDRDRGIITVDIDWRDPEQAARWANLLVERANEELRARKLAELDASLVQLEEELRHAELVELRQAIAGVIESRVNERMLARTRREYAFRVIDPARPADADQPEWPRPAFLAALGTTLGTVLGGAVGLVRRFAARTRPATA
jgi:uncharacterized protein involved in exopolysaccharide biosynthesis